MVEEIKRLKNLRIAYHHYSDAGLKYMNFDGKRKQWLKGVPLFHRRVYGISTDEKSHSKFNFQLKSGWRTFIRPNRPYSEVKTIISEIRESMENNKRKRETEDVSDKEYDDEDSEFDNANTQNKSCDTLEDVSVQKQPKLDFLLEDIENNRNPSHRVYQYKNRK